MPAPNTTTRLTATSPSKQMPITSPHRSQQTVRQLTHRGVNRRANAKPNLAWDHPGKTTVRAAGFPVRDDDPSDTSRAPGSMGPARHDARRSRSAGAWRPDPSARPKATRPGWSRLAASDRPRGPPLAVLPSQAVSDRSSDCPAYYKNHMAVAMPGSVARRLSSAIHRRRAARNYALSTTSVASLHPAKAAPPSRIDGLLVAPAPSLNIWSFGQTGQKPPYDRVESRRVAVGTSNEQRLRVCRGWSGDRFHGSGEGQGLLCGALGEHTG